MPELSPENFSSGDAVRVHGLVNARDDLFTRQELDGVRGSIVRFDAEQNRFAVKVWGREETVLVRVANLTKTADFDREQKRRSMSAMQIAFDLAPQEHEEQLQKRLDVVNKADRVGARLLAEESEMRVCSVATLVQYASAVYHAIPTGYLPDVTSLRRSLYPFWQPDGERMKQATSDDVINAITTAVALRNQDVSIFFRALVFANASKGNENTTLTVPLNAAWLCISYLQDEEVAGVVARHIRPAIDEMFRKHGAPDLQWRDLLWCFCEVYVALMNDLRIQTEISEVRGYEQTVRHVERAKQLPVLRPEDPYSYWIAMHTLLDTDVLLPLDEQRQQLHNACGYARDGLAAAKKLGDPLLLHNFWTARAYWTLTSSHAVIYNTPWSIAEVRRHLRKADESKAKCRAYAQKFDFYRAEQLRFCVDGHLEQAIGPGGPLYGRPGEELLLAPIMVAGCERERTLRENKNLMSRRKIRAEAFQGAYEDLTQTSSEVSDTTASQTT